MEEKIRSEIKQIEKEFRKWDAAISIKDRIKRTQLEEYLLAVQKMISLRQR
ncbi:MAG: hypothetical protein ACXABG_12320 [Promethearchaeota archaeon]